MQLFRTIFELPGFEKSVVQFSLSHLETWFRLKIYVFLNITDQKKYHVV